MAHFAGAGLGTSLAPGILWARMQDAGTQRVKAPAAATRRADGWYRRRSICSSNAPA